MRASAESVECVERVTCSFIEEANILRGGNLHFGPEINSVSDKVMTSSIPYTFYVDCIRRQSTKIEIKGYRFECDVVGFFSSIGCYGKSKSFFVLSSFFFHFHSLHLAISIFAIAFDEHETFQLL